MHSNLILRLFIAGLTALPVFTTAAFSQVLTSSIPVDFSVFRQSTGALLRAQFPLATNATLSISAAREINLLHTAAADVQSFTLTNASQIEIPLSLSDSQRFFTANATVPVDPLDENDGDDLDAAKFSDMLVLGWENVEPGASFHIRVFMIAENGVGTAVSGTLKFTVVNDIDETPVPGMSVTPDSIDLVEQEGFESDLEISGSGEPHPPLAIEVEFQQNTPNSPLPASQQITKKKSLKKQQCPAPSTSEWLHPLGASGTRAAITGSFGEWPGHGSWEKNKIHIHKGVDFKATQGVSVYAAKAGIIISQARDPAYGALVTIKHDDGTWSRYLHVEYLPTPAQGDWVKAGQNIAYVGNFPGISQHLHFEIQTPSKLPVNPADLISTCAQGDSTSPQIASILLRSSNLATHSSGDRAQPASITLPPTSFVGVRIYDTDSRNSDGRRRLTPRSVLFQANNQLSRVYELSDLSSVVTGFQNKNTFGYAYLSYQETNPSNVDKLWYQFWFPWDLSRVGEELSGPARFTLGATDAANNSVSWIFAFGPEIQNKSALAAVTTRQVTATLAAVFGPFPSGQPGVSQLDDIIDLQLKSPNVGIPNAVFAQNNQSVTEATVPANGSKDILITLPDFGGLPSDAAFVLEARSRRCPSVGDSVEIRPKIQPNRIITGATLTLRAMSAGRLVWDLPATISMSVAQPKPESPLNDVYMVCEPVAGFVNLFPCQPLAQFPKRIGAPERPPAFPETYLAGYTNYIAVKTGDDGSRSVAIIASVHTFSLCPLIYCSPVDFFWTGYQIRFLGYRVAGSDAYTGTMQIGAIKDFDPGCVTFFPQQVTDFHVDIAEQ